MRAALGASVGAWLLAAAACVATSAFVWTAAGRLTPPDAAWGLAPRRHARPLARGHSDLDFAGAAAALNAAAPELPARADVAALHDEVSRLEVLLREERARRGAALTASDVAAPSGGATSGASLRAPLRVSVGGARSGAPTRPEYDLPVAPAGEGHRARGPGDLERAVAGVDESAGQCATRVAGGACPPAAASGEEAAKDALYHCPTACGFAANVSSAADAAFALLSDDCAACPPEATRGALWGAAYRPSAATGVALPPEPAVRVVSWTPRVFVIDDFLSAEECDHLIELSKPGMVYTEGPGHNLVGYKTTLNGWQRRDAVVQAVENRIARLTRLPMSHQEPFLMIKYLPGGINKQHHDPLAVTVVIHLQDPEEGNLIGGETHFPTAVPIDEAGNPLPGDEHMCDCAGEKKPGVSVPTKKGTAVMFYSMHPNGEADMKALHGGCVVKRGEKWTAIKWLKSTVA